MCNSLCPLPLTYFIYGMMTVNFCTAPTVGGPYKQKYILGGDTWDFILLPRYNKQDKWEEAKELEEAAYLKEFLSLE